MLTFDCRSAADNPTQRFHPSPALRDSRRAPQQSFASARDAPGQAKIILTPLCLVVKRSFYYGVGSAKHFPSGPVCTKSFLNLGGWGGGAKKRVVGLPPQIELASSLSNRVKIQKKQKQKRFAQLNCFHFTPLENKVFHNFSLVYIIIIGERR